MQIIAIAGAKGSGKSTAANMLIKDYGFVRMRFAQALEDMLRIIGLTEDQLLGRSKELPCELLGGKSPRFAKTSLGTGWGRNKIDPAIWAKILRNKVVELMVSNPQAKVVVDDLRECNEYSMLLSLNAQVVVMRRPEVEVSHVRLRRLANIVHICNRVHSSELSWQKFLADHVIYNTGTVSELEEHVRGLMSAKPVFLIGGQT